MQDEKALDYFMLYIDQIDQWLENKLTFAQIGQLVVLAHSYAKNGIMADNIPDILKWPYGNIVREINATHKKITRKSQQATNAANTRWGNKSQTKSIVREQAQTPKKERKLQDSDQNEETEQEEREMERRHKQDIIDEKKREVNEAIWKIYCKKNHIPDLLRKDAPEDEIKTFIDHMQKSDKIVKEFEQRYMKINFDTASINYEINGKIYPYDQYQEAIGDFMRTHADV